MKGVCTLRPRGPEGLHIPAKERTGMAAVYVRHITSVLRNRVHFSNRRR